MPFCARLIPLNLCVRSIESCKIMSLDVIFNYERLKYAEDPPKTVHSVNSDYGSLVEVFHIIVFIVHNCSFFFLLVFFFFFFATFFPKMFLKKTHNFIFNINYALFFTLPKTFNLLFIFCKWFLFLPSSLYYYEKS